MKSYRELEIYKSAHQLAIEVHELSLKLPKYELYELGSQIRRSSKSISYNIVEGYGRKKYKNDFIWFLIYSQSSCDEVNDQLDYINEIHRKENPFLELKEKYEVLGKQINKFIQYVEKNWMKIICHELTKLETCNQ